MRSQLDAAGEPPATLNGVKATHPVFIDVDPYSCAVRATEGMSLFAVGPLRGDNFVRFSIFDGFGVYRALWASKSQHT